jgi:hypothetical protein
MDASRAGAASTVHVNQPPEIIFHHTNSTVVVGDDQAAGKLFHDHAILLDSNELPWSSEYAYRLLETYSGIPQRETRNFYSAQTLPMSKWSLVDEEIPNDIDIIVNITTGERVVRVAVSAFVNAAPQVGSLDGIRGTFFSRRLHHALIRFVTKEGADTSAVQYVMETRYGCTTDISNALYTSLTALTTSETEASFQNFDAHTEEPLLVLTMFEELPAGFHAIAGLSYLLRRADGYEHPLYPAAAAVAWPKANIESYIEFMESAFHGDLRHTRRLILHVCYLICTCAHNLNMHCTCVCVCNSCI